MKMISVFTIKLLVDHTFTSGIKYIARLFFSLQDAWKNCQESFSDFKELIPEFYDSTGTFLTNNPVSLLSLKILFDRLSIVVNSLRF